MEKRIKTAVKFLKDGQSFKVGDLKLGIESSGVMYVIGWSRYYSLENLTKSGALRELREIKYLFQMMVDTSADLKEFVQNRSIEYNLAFNYGQGSIGICSEKDKVLTWEINLMT